MAHEIKLYGPIDGWFNSAKEIMGGIPRDAKEVVVRIHSPGGSVGEGIALHNALKAHPARIVTIVDGYAASIASVVMQAGDERRVHRSSLIFAHNPWTQAEGDAEDLRKSADHLDKHAEVIRDIYMESTGKTEAEIRQIMEDEEFFTGPESRALGFSDTVIGDEKANMKIAAMIHFDKIAAQAGEKRMSITTKHQAALDRADAAEKEATEAKDAMAVQGKQIEAKDAEIERIKTEAAADLESVQNKLDATEANYAAQVEDLNAKLAEQTEIAAKAKAFEKELADLKRTVAENPALAQAAKDDQNAGDFAVQADAEVDKIEAEARAAAANREPRNILEQYEAMDPGPERRAFFADNKRAILACEKEGNDNA